LDNYQRFIALSRYARFIDEESRRETWEETVNRYISFWGRTLPELDRELANELLKAGRAIHDLEVMPSMRSMMTAGPALERDNVAGYNCAYIAVDHPRVFDEILYVLMCGTGVGFSVERRAVEQLPPVAETHHETDTTIIVSDSKVGWASAFRELLSLLWAGKVPKWDVSKVRPAGARLHTFGGRASGPDPLDDLFRYTVSLFKNAAGRRLNTLECHDLVCKVASIVVVGGVRRSALISLSNLTDQRLRHAKDGEFPHHRYLSNNSVCYTERPDVEVFMEEWLSLYRSRSGERGIFNRVAADKQVARNGRRETGKEWGTNPCSEIILRPAQFCNLSEVVVRSTDTLGELERKVRLATFLGTLQSTLTNFRYLRPIWRDNCEEERLLGVSLTGIMDHPILGDPDNELLPHALEVLRNAAIEENAKWADHLGIARSAAITCVKPSGTVSQLVDSASGIHARYSPFYIRRVRADKKDPLAQWMIFKGFPHEDDKFNPNVLVFSFPQRAPEGAVVEGQYGAIKALELWKIYQDHWCEHKPSITVHYKDPEFLEVGAWVYRNIDAISGVAFLPKDDHVYAQAPYEAITEDQYWALKSTLPEVDWDEYGEGVDNTTGTQTMACTGGVCEVVDLTQ
jgi:ribonucleoside-triphosphate reductase